VAVFCLGLSFSGLEPVLVTLQQPAGCLSLGRCFWLPALTVLGFPPCLCLPFGVPLFFLIAYFLISCLFSVPSFLRDLRGLVSFPQVFSPPGPIPRKPPLVFLPDMFGLFFFLTGPARSPSHRRRSACLRWAASTLYTFLEWVVASTTWVLFHLGAAPPFSPHHPGRFLWFSSRTVPPSPSSFSPGCRGLGRPLRSNFGRSSSFSRSARSTVPRLSGTPRPPGIINGPAFFLSILPAVFLEISTRSGRFTRFPPWIFQFLWEKRTFFCDHVAGHAVPPARPPYFPPGTPTSGLVRATL